MSLFIFVFSYFLVLCSGSLSDVTGNILHQSFNGVIAAFGDFDADKDTDIFVISDDGLSLSLFLASVDGTFDIVTLLSKENTNGSLITSVMPGDFDGDTEMDVLVTYRSAGSDDWKVQVKIYWGDTDAVGLESTPLIFPDLMLDQPLVLDANGDMIPDLFGEKSEGQRFYWLLSTHRNFTEEKVMPNALPAMRKPQSSAFVDFNNDLTADLCVLSEYNDTLLLEIWLNVDGILTPTENISFPYDFDVIGQMTFVDLDGDQKMDILLPVCKDKDCIDSKICVWSNNDWKILNVGLTYRGLQWTFSPDADPKSGHFKAPITLRVGDYNLDGFPDVLAVLHNKSNGNTTQRTFILQNIGCQSDQCNTFPRTFSISEMISVDSFLASFYDLYEDGILDLLITSFEPGSSNMRIHIFSHTFTDDACFVKVKVLSGLCYENCPGSRDPYGVNQPGPVVRYYTVDLNGNSQKATASQLSQSAHFSLQLPFTVFGLGQTPNFVDTLEVGIPYPEGKSPRHSTWTSIIPNSQLVVIPYPNDSPSSWVNKLFVTPSRNVMLTGASLLGTCGFIAGLVGILHWREKVEDKKEKLQESHRFHFDAM